MGGRLAPVSGAATGFSLDNPPTKVSDDPLAALSSKEDLYRFVFVRPEGHGEGVKLRATEDIRARGTWVNSAFDHRDSLLGPDERHNADQRVIIELALNDEWPAKIVFTCEFAVGTPCYRNTRI